MFALSLLLVGAVLIFSGGTASAKQFATLRLLDGQVAVQRGNGAFETGQDGTSLREGDTVRTGPDGRASIEEGYLRLVRTACDLAEEYHRSRALTALREQHEELKSLA